MTHTTHNRTAGFTEGGFIRYWIFLVLVFFGIIIAGIIEFARVSHTRPWSPTFYEEEHPVITWVTPPVGIGADPLKLSARVSDSGGGIDEIIVRISQRNQPQQLMRFTPDGAAVPEREISFTIDPKQLNLREGKADLEILAFDRTLWSNGEVLTDSLPVDFSKPRIEVVTPMQNAVEGGIELVFFKVVGKKPSVQGVDAHGTLYPAFQARLWDPAFKSYETLYFAFFPIPIGFREDLSRMRISVRDDIGNSATAPFNYRVRHRKFSSGKVEISPENAEKLAEYLRGFAKDASVHVKTSGTTTADLPTLLKALKAQDEAILSEMLSKTDGRRWWQGQFGRPVPNAPSSFMGDEKHYFVAGQQIWADQMTGVRFGVSNRTAVMPANSGRVTFVGSLGLLGKTVVIDHGFGLATIYGHLSEISVTVGDEVSTTKPIGKTGSTGLSQSEEVYFEIRLHGVPVSPNEWWDATWLKDHIDNKVGFVQRALIGTPGE